MSQRSCSHSCPLSRSPFSARFRQPTTIQDLFCSTFSWSPVLPRAIPNLDITRRDSEAAERYPEWLRLYAHSNSNIINIFHRERNHRTLMEKKASSDAGQVRSRIRSQVSSLNRLTHRCRITSASISCASVYVSLHNNRLHLRECDAVIASDARFRRFQLPVCVYKHKVNHRSVERSSMESLTGESLD